MPHEISFLRSTISRMALFALVWLQCAGCTPASMQPDDEAVALWGRWEGILVAEEPADPKTNVAVQFTSPEGETRTVDAFWDGGTTWKVRFMPDTEGTWRFGTVSEPVMAGLHGVQGTFEVRRSDEQGSPFSRHGAVRVSENGRHLVHADGTPFFWLGDTAWNGALRSTAGDWSTYLNDRREKHFTGIQFVTTQWRAALASEDRLVAYTGFEDIQINPAFFQRIDDRISAINEAGLLAAPVLLWTLGEPEQNPGRLPEDQAIRLARYLVARYGAHHVMWILAGDENYSGDTGARWRRIGRAVFDTPLHAPVTLHPQGMQWHFDDFADEDWLDVIIYQSGHGDDPETLAWMQTGPPAQKWNQNPPRPIINSEPPYEDHVAYQSRQPHTAYNVRRAVYWSLLNTPTAGVTYGAHGIWSWETEPAVPLNHEGAGIAKPWSEAMHFEGSSDMRHAADLFTSIDWWTLEPAPDLIANQPGTEDPASFIGSAGSSAGDLAILYLPVGGEVHLNDERIEPGLEASWFDPREGTYLAAEPSSTGIYAAPDSRDWVLLFTNRN